ncbi:MAG TPA: type IV pilus twitching motility protein PilT [Patescibacteria group bacterium]|nr:type IV pilus twitching motility protein PilT [Patescibacteria group bacterium]
MTIRDLLQLTVDRNASDLHIVVGIAPTLRIDEELIPVPNEQILTPEIMETYLKELLNSNQLESLATNKEIDFSISFSEKARFRVNAYTQKGTWGVAFRKIPLIIPSLDELKLPKIMNEFVNMRQGFVLITGPTGHGKSTTLASVINEINKTRSVHIVTIEDPVEFIFNSVKSIISQREMHEDTHSWSIALRSVLREDPNVVLIGEMRDYETIAAALTIAETGHLVFATLHTNSAAETVDRIVDVFPDEQQDQVRLQLSNVLAAVVSQRLMPAISGGRIVATEVMTASNAIKTAIREGKTHQIRSVIQTSGNQGMYTLESSLASMVKEGKITAEVATNYSTEPEELARLMRS